MTTGRAGPFVCAVVVIAVLGVGLLAGTVGSARLGETAPVTFGDRARVVTLAAFGDRGSHVLAYAHREQVTLSFPLTNRGRVPVTVTGVRLSRDPQSMVQLQRVAADGRPLPVRLRPGQSTEITVSARYDNCRFYHEREIESMAGAIVDAEVLGFGVTREVPFDHDLLIHSPMIVGCPDRTLDRSDDVRTG